MEWDRQEERGEMDGRGREMDGRGEGGGGLLAGG